MVKYGFENFTFEILKDNARGTRRSHKGYVFRYLDENNRPIQNSNFAKIKFNKVQEKILPEYKYLISC